MDTKMTKPENEFNFIQEKVVKRRKNKVKKFAIATITTIVLAAVFGLVARIVFVKSEGFINKLLGIDSTKRSEILFPTNGQEEVLDDDNNALLTPGQSVAEVSTTPLVTPTPEVTEVPTPQVEPEVQTIVVEQKIPATISDYERILYEIKKVANSVNNSLVTVIAIESKKDWQEETYESKKSTTGIVLGENNAELLVLTDLNKVKNATQLELSFSGGFSVNGELWDYDTDYNLAVIAVKLKDITPLQLSTIKTAELGESYSITVGSAIIGLGHPNGIAGSMELGMITGKGMYHYIMDNRLDLFTTDIISNSNSDGVIIGMDGSIIGIITSSDDSDNNVSTAIGISRLKPIIEKLTNKYDRILFGITGEDMPEDVLEGYELENGIYVTKVLQDSPAYNGDIRQGDIITAINEYSISSITNLASILNNFKVDDEITVKVYRLIKGELKEVELTVTLSKK